MAGFSESSTVQAWPVERPVALKWPHVPMDNFDGQTFDVGCECMTTLMSGDTTFKYIGTDQYVPLKVIDFERPRSEHRRPRNK